MSMNEIADKIMKWRVDQGFYTPNSINPKFPTEVLLSDNDAMLGKLMLVSSEVAEAAEAVRDGDMENFAEELADVIIRVFDIAATVGIDIDEVVGEKMRINAARPKKHGRTCNL